MRYPSRSRWPHPARLALSFLLLTLFPLPTASAGDSPRSHRFSASSKATAQQWQTETRQKLFELMMGGTQPPRISLQPQILRQIPVPAGGYVLEEIRLRSLPDRDVQAWLARPLEPRAAIGAVLALHGHGGTGEQIVRGQGLYGYGRACAEMGYVVIAPNIGQHDLQHPHWTLMGERTWDALRCVDYLVTRPEVDPHRIALAGLSLGGETAMYVAALDPRIQVTCISGWLTTVENMKHGHCPCWNFPGLEQHFDFSDIFACIAPRSLVCELGEQERAPGGFPVNIGRAAFAELQQPYRILGAANRAQLTVHPAGHVFNGRDFWPLLDAQLGRPWPWDSPPPRVKTTSPADTLDRQAEIARRCFQRALGVFEGWWATRDPATGLLPRQLTQPVWAPADNAADLFPFLALTCAHLAPQHLEEVVRLIRIERQLTTRQNGLPDWYALTNRAFLYPEPDPHRLIFGAAEYSKDGLLPLTEALGHGPWSDRLFELVDAIFQHPLVPSAFGPLPADNTEVNGELLQVLSRLHFMTGNPKYLRWAQPILEAYCFEVLPQSRYLPAHRWDFTQHRATADVLNLNDHGNEIVGGLSEGYLAFAHAQPTQAARYRPPLEKMVRQLLDCARNPDGFWIQRIQPSTLTVSDSTVPDTWGYALSGLVTFGLAWNDPAPRRAARLALRHLDRPAYLDWNGADAYADSLEGGLVLLNRFEVPQARDWVRRMLPIFLGKPREDGVVEGWYGDGNYARTALMAGWYFTQGVKAYPWHPGLRYAARKDKNSLHLWAQSDSAWSGRLAFDRPRHRLHFQLPINYPRLNEFPEWYTVQEDTTYEVRLDTSPPQRFTGAQLAHGLPLDLQPQTPASIKVTPVKSN